MGSRCRIVVYAPSERAGARAAKDAFASISRLNSILSDYDPDSEASRLTARAPGVWHAVSPELADVLRRSRKVHDASAGAFDPAVGRLTRLWRKTKRDGTLPAPAELDAAMHASGLEHFEVDPSADLVRFDTSGLVLDFGGIGKGYAADQALRVLESHGLGTALIDFGGDLVLGDPPPGHTDGWLVAVRTGLDEPRTLHLGRCAVATSGGLEQFVEIDGTRYAHIIDPRTGLGVTRRTAATVIAPHGWLADALASAACVLGPDRLDALRDACPDIAIEVVSD